jgi:enterochelin esterase-like enzyme
MIAKKMLFLVSLLPAVACAESRLVTVGIPTNGIVPKSPAAEEDVRLVTVYLPDGYDATDERYPVVYYLPGFSGTNETFTESNKIILDALIEQKRSVPMIVVYNDPSLANDPDPKCQRRYTSCWYTNSALNGLFEDFITNNTVAFIDANFRTKANFAFRAIMGQSMGGYGSILLGMRHPDVFRGFGSASGTSFWTIATTQLASPGNPAFTLNSFILPEIPTDGPNAGKIHPSNGILTEQVFSYSGALSPNFYAVRGIPVTPFVDEFCIDLPVFVQGDGTPIPNTGAGTGADPVTGAPLVFPNTLVLNEAVINRWRENDPFFVMDGFVDTLREQCIYLDGGDTELALAVGARILSEKFANNQINHEYILYMGGHTTCLTSIFCSRHSAMFQYFSAKFAEAGTCPDTVRARLIGKGTVIIENDAQMIINKNAWVSIETAPDLTVTETDIAIELKDRAQVLIGTDTTPGGSLQIGNSFSKALIFGNPSLGNNTIRGSITINGPEALLNVGTQGFLGLGAGADGKAPDIPNKWGISSLTNVTNLLLDVNQGVFQHNQITSGQDRASVLAIGPSDLYTIKVDPSQAVIRGGANFVCLPDGRLRHPIVLDKQGQIQPETAPQCTELTCDVRTNLNTSTNIDDYFYKQQMASTGFYTLPSTANMLKSSEQLDDRASITNPFELINATSLDMVCEFLNANPYREEASKEGAIASHNGRLRIGYIDVEVSDDTVENIFVRTDDIPIGCKQRIDFDKILKTGTIGIWVEEVDGKRKLIRVYDLKPK